MKRKTLLITLMLCFAFLGVAKAQQSLPYSYGFENNDLAADGWTTANPYNSNASEFGINSSAAHNGSYGFRFSSYNRNNAGYDQYLFSPELNGSNPIVMTFWYKTSSSYGMEEFSVGYSSTDTDPDSFTWVDDLSISNTNWTESEEYSFPRGTKYVAIWYYSEYQYRLFVDDFSFSVDNPCTKPTGLSVSNIGGATAYASWTAGVATRWNLQYKKTSETKWTSESGLTNAEFNLRGLDPGTVYEVQVQTDCGDGTSAWTNSVTFTTAFCDVEDQCEINYDLTDSYGDGWNGNYIEVVDVQTGTVLASWTISSGSSASGTFNVCDGRQIQFKYVGNSYPSENSFVITDHLNEVIWEVGQCSSSTGNMTYTVDCSVPSCFKPTDLAVNSITNESAVATWTAGDEKQTSWNLQYKKTSEVQWTSVNGLSEPNYTFAHLEAGTVYEVQVQGDCRQEGLSDWTSSVTFTTALCGAEDQCEITYELYANYSVNGWTYNGTSYLQIVDTNTGTILANLTENSGTGVTEGTIAVCDGRDITFQWISGSSYDSQLVAGFIIYDATGEQILNNEGALSRPFTYSVVCPTCFKPTNLEATNVGTESAVLNWEGTSASYVLQYRTAAQNINMTEWHQIGEDVTATATETTYTFDLSDYEGEGYVAIRHYNVTNMYFLDVDNITVTDPDGETVLVSADGTSIPSTWTNQDVDGDGYVWTTSAISGYFVSQSYENDYGPLTPDNWLIIPVSNLGGTLSFTAKGQDSSFPAENFGVFVTTSTLTDALQPVAAGNWSDEITTTDQSYQITGLTANTPYEWQVKGVCDTDDESTWATSTFTTTELGAKNFVTEGNWDVADNWSPVGVPTIDDKVIISANATVPAGVVATAKKITLNGGTLTIADGGQLKQNGNVELVMEKEIEAYGTSNGNYYFIASPLTTTRLTFIQDWSYVNALTGNYDLYAFDPTQELEWINYKSSSDHALFTSGQNNPVLVQQTGYLYANEEGITLQFEGTTAVKSNENVLYQELSFNAEATDSFNGWTLIGNPYTCDAYISYVDADGNALDADFYTLNLDNTYTLMTSQDGLAPCTGALISMSATGKVQYSTEAPAGKASMLDMTVTEGRGKVDQARIRFGVGYGLEKKSFRANSSSLYIPQNNKDYAVVYAENTGEMPVNFKAETNGNFTISFTNEEVEFSYLHLIDNLTGADVDLLANPSYSFEAKTTDYTSRFKLVFATGNSVNGNDFGFISNNHLKIFGIEGNATVKVMDITGRTLSTENFNGSYDKQLNLSAGVYMIQLIQGNDVKTQKIVIR
jgi:hypothetical protein